MKSLHEIKQLLPGKCLPRLPDEMLTKAVLRSWNSGSMIVPEETRVDGIYYVCEGMVRVLRNNADGARRTLFIVNNGHFFFEAHFFCAPTLFSLAEAVTPAVTAFFPSKTAHELLETNKLFREQIMQSLAAKALGMGELLEGAYDEPQERLLRVLVNLLESSGRPNGRHMDVAVSQDELAELVGLHRVSVNRSLRKLEQMGRVRLNRKCITILDYNA